MSNVLEQAEAAFEQSNWCLLQQSLQQLMVDCTAEDLSDRTLERVLALAVAVLEAGDFQDRWEIAKLFPALGDRAIAPLTALLQDADADLEARWFTARILGRYNHSDVVIALLHLLQTADSEELSGIAAEALANIGTPAIEALTELLEQYETRTFAVQALARIRCPETIEPLLSVVADPQPQVRAIVVEALSSFHDPRVPPVLMQTLSDPEATVRQEAVTGLGMRSDLAASMNLVALLAKHLQDLDPGVCQKAAAALGRMQTEQAAAALLSSLTSPHTPPSLQLELVRALGWMETATALDGLRQILWSLDAPSFHPVQQEIVAILGRWTKSDLQGQAAECLLALLTSRHPLTDEPAIRQTIAVSLGALGQAEALDALMELLADEELSVRLHAIAALKVLDSTTARQRLEGLVSRSDVPEALKQGAAIALQEW